MASKKRNLPTKKSKNTSTKLLGQGSSDKFHIGKFLINETAFESFQDTELLSEILLQTATCIIMIYMLAQIRFSLPAAKPDAIDQRGSCKYFKTKFIANVTGRIFATGLIIGTPEVTLHAPVEGFNEWVGHVINAYVGNERKLPNCSKDNVVQFIHGQVSSAIGYMNSCPSTNTAALGISQNCISWSIEEVLSNLDNSQLSAIKPEDIINNIHSYVFPNGPTGNNGDPISLSFTEAPLTGENSVNGLTVLENEIFDTQMSRSLKPAGKAQEESSKVLQYKRNELLGKFPILLIKKYEALIYFKRWSEVERWNESIKMALETIPVTEGE